MGRLSNFWARATGEKPPQGPLRLHPGRRAYFQVNDPALARTLGDWATCRNDAAQIISAYLRKATPLLGAETPHYKVDEDGRVESISFRYGIGLTHEGWIGIPGTNWLVPETDDVKRDIDALPRLPGFGPVHDALNWPTADVSTMAQARHLPGYVDFAKRANSQIRVCVRHDAVYVSVPFPDTFRDYPPLQDAVQAWRPDPRLTRIEDPIGRAAERQNDLSQSPLGQALIKIMKLVP